MRVKDKRRLCSTTELIYKEIKFYNKSPCDAFLLMAYFLEYIFFGFGNLVFFTFTDV